MPMMGSPPRMRGKLTAFSLAPVRAGITPAHAGKTEEMEDIYQSFWDHPRACGENLSPDPLPTEIEGSPPRMRGKRGRERYERRADGITPAHAGKTCIRHGRGLQ